MSESQHDFICSVDIGLGKAQCENNKEMTEEKKTKITGWIGSSSVAPAMPPDLLSAITEGTTLKKATTVDESGKQQPAGKAQATPPIPKETPPIPKKAAEAKAPAPQRSSPPPIPKKDPDPKLKQPPLETLSSYELYQTLTEEDQAKADEKKQYLEKTREATLIHHATAGNLAAVNVLLAADTDPNAESDSDGKTPLIKAVSGYHEDVVDVLIKVGANVNLADRDGITPLMHAIIPGVIPEDPTMVLKLLNQGADYTVILQTESWADPLIRVTTLGETALSFVKKNGYLVIENAMKDWLTLKWKSSTKDNEKELRKAAAAGDYELVKELLKKGTNPDATAEEDGDTALHIVLEREADDNLVKVVNILAVSGADLDKVDGSGITPLISVASKLARAGDEKPTAHMEKILEELLKFGADYSVKAGEQDETPLTALSHAIAAAGEGNKAVEILKKWDSEKLLNAVRRSDKDEVERLLKAGVNPNTYDVNGQNALHYVAQFNIKNMVETLVSDNGEQQHGVANRNKKNKNGATPLIIAANMGHNEVVTELLTAGRAGLPLNLEAMQRGKTALQIAQQKAKPRSGESPENFAARKAGTRLIEEALKTEMDRRAATAGGGKKKKKKQKKNSKKTIYGKKKTK